MSPEVKKLVVKELNRLGMDLNNLLFNESQYTSALKETREAAARVRDKMDELEKQLGENV